MGWASKENGDLLGLAASHFDVFLTVDRNLSDQQDVTRFKIAIVVMAAQGNKYSDLQPLVAKVLVAIGDLVTGHVVKVSSQD